MSGFYLEQGLDKPQVITPKTIKTRLCQESVLIGDGYFYLPDGLTPCGKQMYRKLTTVYDEEVHKRNLEVSSEWYINDGGAFVVGGIDEVKG